MFAVSVEFDMSSDNFDLESIFALEEYVRKTYKCESDAGAGFGFRDVTFYIDDEVQAWDALCYIRYAYPPASDSIHKINDETYNDD